MTSLELANAATARQRYLENASDLMMIRCSATSAHLQRSKKGSLTDVQDECPSCALTRLPGWTCKQLFHGKQQKINKKKATKEITVQCSLCHQKSVLTMKKRHTFVASSISRPLPEQTSTIRDLHTTTTPTAKATPPIASRKARAKKSSLQALLGKAKEQKSQVNGYGLGFADLLKS